MDVIEVEIVSQMSSSELMLEISDGSLPVTKDFRIELCQKRKKKDYT